MSSFVGMQIGAVSFTDEGVPQVLDSVQERGAANAILLSAMSWLRGTAGRAHTGFPDHGGQEPDDFEGGGYFKPNLELYGDSPIRDFQAPEKEVQGFDILADVIPEARKRGLKVYPYYCERYRTFPTPVSVPGFRGLVEIDHVGRKASRPCLNNPGYRAFMHAVVEDWCKSHDIDGVLWGIERRGPLGNTLDADQPSCFCRYCEEIGHREGIDVRRARQGYLELANFVHGAKSGVRPRDGYFIGFMRILFAFPEILAWDSLWTRSHKTFAREIYGLVKWIDPNLEVGMHLWQYINTYDPFLKAQYDLSELSECADWIKPVVYQTPAGSRFKRYVERHTSSIWGDFEAPELLQFLYRILNLREAEYDKLAEVGFSADYIRDEIRRTVDACPGIPVYSGVNVGVEAYDDERPIEPSDVRTAIEASYEGGAEGVILSRNYSETWLRNLDAAGDTLRALGKA